MKVSRPPNRITVKMAAISVTDVAAVAEALEAVEAAFERVLGLAGVWGMARRPTVCLTLSESGGRSRSWLAASVRTALAIERHSSSALRHSAQVARCCSRRADSAFESVP